MASERAQSRCRERLERLSESTLDSDSLRREAIDDLQRTIGFDRWCRPLADPETQEREVVALLVAELDTRAVTERLFISQHTVQDHLKSVFEKIGVHSRRQLLATLAASSN